MVDPGGFKDPFALGQYVTGSTMMDIIRREHCDPAMTMLDVVPGEERAAQGDLGGQTSTPIDTLGFRGGFRPMSLPLFQGGRRESEGWSSESGGCSVRKAKYHPERAPHRGIDVVGGGAGPDGGHARLHHLLAHLGIGGHLLGGLTHDQAAQMGAGITLGDAGELHEDEVAGLDYFVRPVGVRNDRPVAGTEEEGQARVLRIGWLWESGC